MEQKMSNRIDPLKRDGVKIVLVVKYHLKYDSSI
jgi:hypothetical protein